MMPNSRPDLNATRLSLIGRLHDWEDQSSWRRFFDIYGELLHAWCLAAGLSPTEAEEAVQDTVVSVAKAMRDGQFERRGEGSFKAWLYGIARHRIGDKFRRRRPREIASGEVAEHATEATVEGELERLWDAEWAGHRLRRAAAATAEKVSAAQFQMFDLYVLREWSVDAVKSALGVSRAQIYMAKLRVGAVFRQALQEIDD
ncbi:MAG: sigma-70 family RNA polymerase sigma factor [Verrucomicrobiales bacterium]